MINPWRDVRRSPVGPKLSSDHRNAFEHDYDRLLFSTPVRRLADKTQVFPLDRNDAVRTRLTHSHEVANLARSMGRRLFDEEVSFEGGANLRQVSAILSAIGLAHDLGNPPFGHQGEAAIGHWFRDKMDVFESSGEEGVVPSHLHDEFLKFEGNAQTIRILTRLQVGVGNVGLDLTAGTLSALLKYPVACDEIATNKAQTKKYGFFESEREVIEWIRSETCIVSGIRHPLTWIMEAADDIAYAVLDIEDAIRKGILSPDDIRALINHGHPEKYKSAMDYIEDRFQYTRQQNLSISATREILSSYLRTVFIQNLIDEAILDYKNNIKTINSGAHETSLMQGSYLLDKLKEIAKTHVFVVSDVRKIEADGFRIIGGLMDFYWNAITNRKSPEDILSRRLDAKSAFGLSKLSDNYLQCAARNRYIDRNGNELSLRYNELRLLTDMVSGMTDGFAKSEYDFLKANDFI